MKTNRLLVIFYISIALVIASTPIFAALAPDFSISFGHVVQYDDYHKSGLSTSAGVTKGLTERLELLVLVQTELTPDFLGDAQVGADLAFSLLGKRWDKEGFAGAGINMLASIGFLAGANSPDHEFEVDSIVVKFTPISLGTPHTGKRDRLCTIGIIWNFRDNRLAFVWNFMICDFYVCGTWRDDESLRFSD